MTDKRRRLSVATAFTCALFLGVGSTAAHAAPTVSQTAAAPSTDPAGAWSKVGGELAANKNGVELSTGAVAAEAFRLNAAALIAALAGAPLENSGAAETALPVISIPGADGELHNFTIVDSPVMEPALAAKVPFRSYAATSVDEPGVTARLDYSPTIGFHATVRSPEGSWNVDPAYAGDITTYVAHHGTVQSSPAEQELEDQAIAAASQITTLALPTPGDVVTQRVYRMALASDPGYATQVGAADVDAVKAAVMNRVNQIYNDDLAIKLVLVGNNDLLAFNTAAAYTGANGPCGADPCFVPVLAGNPEGDPADDLSACTGPKIFQVTSAIDRVIGSPNYDIGHILDAGGAGGLAAQGVGVDEVKGAACSGASGSGRGDNLAVEFFSHEIGHQFSASHSFSSASCGSFSAPNAVEIASGATIMSYAGTCAYADNIQTPSDPYFSQQSIRQIQTYITTPIDPADNGGEAAENGGSSTVTTTNHSPVVTVPGALAIPVRTPFTLSGTVTDADGGQNPVNVWEQNDVGGIRPLMDNNKPDGPLFRIFSEAANAPTYDADLDAPGLHEATAAGSTRTLPDLAQIASGNTNQAAGTCATAVDPDNPTSDEIECFAEFLPTSARTLHFDLTARDRFATGGGVSTAETVVTVAGSTPFAVTNAAASVVEGASYNVTWNVAGTTAAPFTVANVKVSYSTDGGLSFPTVLSASAANDGSETITIPAGITTTGRFKVEAIGQPFFDISHADLTVTAGPVTSAPVFTASTPPATGPVGTAYSYTFVATGAPAPTFSVASGTLPAGLTLSAAGVLSGTPTTPGASTFTVQASNGIGSPAVTPSRTVTISAATSAPVFSASTPPATGTIGTPYSYTFVATGAPAPTFSVASGTLPAGLTLSAAGVLSGTPTTAGASTFTVRASNGVGTPAVTPNRTVTISPAAGTAPTITGTPGNGVSGTAYTFQFTVAGSPTPTVTKSAGTLPAGLTLSAAGKLSGTPTTAGSYTFTVKATNSVGSATRSVTVTITAGAAKTVTVSAGNGQTAEVNTAFGTKLAAKVTDQAGNAKAGVVVTFKVTSGPAKFPGSATTVTATTGSNGVATAAVLTAGSTTGAVVVTATAAGTSTATFNLTVKKTPTADISTTISGPSSAARNTTFTETIKVKNSGPVAATSTKTTLAVPSGVSIVSAPGAQTVKKNGNYYLVWNTSSVAVGTTVTFTATFKVNSSARGTVTFCVTADSTVKDPNTGNNTAYSNIRLG